MTAEEEMKPHAADRTATVPNDMSLLCVVAEELLKDIRKTYQSTCKIPDDQLLALKFVFGSSALQALDLVDQRSVTCLTSPSGCKVFQVMGASGSLYTCYSSCHYCSCLAFSFSVIHRSDRLLCKHILAVYLCQAMGLIHEESVSDSQMCDILSGRVGSGT